MEKVAMYTLDHSFETRPSGSIRDPADPRLEPGRVEEKIEKEKTRRPG
jgi:hypothetical protein